MYSYYRSVTVDSSKVGAQDLTDYPVLFSGTYAYLKTVANGGGVQSASGYDIQFYSDSALTTALSFERVAWDATTGACEFRVKVPSISHTSNTVIYLAYGDATVSSDQQNVAGTWNSGYLQVSHLEGNSTAAVGNNGTDTNATYSTSYGKIGQGVRFTGNGQIDLTATDLNTPAISVSFWFNPTNFTNEYARIYCKDLFGTGQLIVGTRTTAHMVWYIDATGGTVYTLSGTAALSPSTWYMLTLCYDSTSGLKGYINTTEDASVAANGTFRDLTGGHAYLGNDPDNAGTNTSGYVDELHVWNAFISSDLITAKYNNESSPSTFYTIGEENGVGGGGRNVTARTIAGLRSVV